MTAVILLALLYDHYGEFERVQGILRGISSVGVGLIVATGFKMLKEDSATRPYSSSLRSAS